MHHSDATLRELIKRHGFGRSIPCKAVDHGRPMCDLIPMVPEGKYHGCLVKWNVNEYGTAWKVKVTDWSLYIHKQTESELKIGMLGSCSIKPIRYIDYFVTIICSDLTMEIFLLFSLNFGLWGRVFITTQVLKPV